MITGPSGAGKSTVCLAIAGILHHEYGGKKGGSVLINGKDVKDYKDLGELAANVGIVFDDPEAQLIFTSVEEEIISALEHRDLSEDEIGKRLESILEKTNLTNIRERPPHELSGGQKQRVALAATLALGNDLIILDEPTSELDEHATDGIFEVLKVLKKEGRTIVLVEHKFNRFQELADTVVLLEKGKVIAHDEPEKILKDKSVHDALIPDFSSFRLKGVNLHRDRKPVIIIESLTHNYGEIPALAGVDITIDNGEFIAIVGENGSGKTTLIKHLIGLLRPDKGRIVIDGEDIEKKKVTDIAHSVGLVFQNPDHMFFADTVELEVEFGPKNLNLPLYKNLVDEALREVNLLHAKDLYPRWLSRGERQRLAIACVLAMKPKILIFDEPTTGLDGNEAKEVMEVLKRLQEEGHTIIIVTHNRQIATNCADRLVLMESGKIIEDISLLED